MKLHLDLKRSNQQIQRSKMVSSIDWALGARISGQMCLNLFFTSSEISTSISEALHPSSSNSSLTSVSSPKSDRDFDDADINVNERM